MLKSTNNPLALIGRRQSALERLIPVITPQLDQIDHLGNYWFIDIAPRLTAPADLEVGARIITNSRLPEIVAARLRAAKTFIGGAP